MSTDDQTHRYHTIRAILEALVSAPGKSSPALKAAHSYLSSHCELCGENLPQGDLERSEPLCSDCRRRFLVHHKRRSAAEMLEVLLNHGLEPAHSQQLVLFLTSAPDRELYRFNPYYVADQLEIKRREILPL